MSPAAACAAAGATEIVDAVRRGAEASRSSPYVLLTYAQSVDGSIGAHDPTERLVLSGDESMSLTHALRSVCDAVCVGVGTVVADDPRLTVRLPQVPEKQPAAVVFDRTLRTPINCRLVKSAKSRRVIIVSSRADDYDNASLRDAGCEFVAASTLSEAISALYEVGIGSLMIEGGATIISEVLCDRIAHDLVVTIAPVLVGGLKPLPRPPRRRQIADDDQSTPSSSSSSSLHLRDPIYRVVGNDIVLYAHLNFHTS